ncbi:hypothetical protein QQZ08_002524 [Neonectria magnoliae]|uniref:Uncharacterized protein n=1 Tax=Neonectria magnoliae TaxID=2732573 RepID=A0ABR1ICL5_9HYPO
MAAQQEPPVGESSTPLLTKCRTLAKDDPNAFLSYLRTEMDRGGTEAEELLSQAAELKKIKGLCEKGARRPLSQSYLPTARLRFLYRRYMLEDEWFPFIELEKPLTSSEGVGPWAFLQTHFGVMTTDGLDFYLHLLFYIRLHNWSESMEIEYPRRVLELYLRIHAECRSSSDFPTARQRVRTMFETHKLVLTVGSWTKPSQCLQNSSIHLPLKVVVLPPPKSWDATDAECAELTHFYHDTLGIPSTYSWTDLLDHLEGDQAKGAFQSNLPAFYSALDEMVPRLSDQDVKDLRKAFDNKSYIGLVNGTAVTWYKLVDCVWAPGLNFPGKLDLSEHYPKLESFFAGFLKIPKYDCGVVYKELINLDADQISVSTLKDMLWSLNAALPEYGHLMDAGKLLERPVLPIKDTNGQVNLCSVETEYFIPDREFLQQQFSDKVRMLDFTPHEIWLLEPLILWASIEHLYLSWNVGVATYRSRAPVEPIANISAARALGLLRIASHFRSPRVQTADERATVLRKLQQSQFFQAEEMYLRLFLSTNDSVIEVDEIETDLHIEESDDRLRIYLPHDEEAHEFCLISRLPRRLVGWMMTDPASEEVRAVDEVAVSLVKSILRARDTLVPAVLDAEGVVKAEDLGPTKREKSRHYGSWPSCVEFGSGSATTDVFGKEETHIPLEQLRLTDVTAKSP